MLTERTKKLHRVIGRTVVGFLAITVIVSIVLYTDNVVRHSEISNTRYQLVNMWLTNGWCHTKIKSSIGDDVITMQEYKSIRSCVTNEKHTAMKQSILDKIGHE